MKKYVKYAILGAVMAVALIAVGLHAIRTVTEIELKKSSYTRTLFDLHIAAPSVSQLDALEKEGATDTVFPYYAYKKAFSKDEITLLVSDRMEDASVSILGEGTLIEGAFDKEGVMLDKTAADALGVGVGDALSFRLLGKQYTKTVAAIYLPSTLAIMEEGVVLVSAEDGMLGAAAPLAYSGAFISSHDRTVTAAYLSDYAGEGNVALSYEQYVALKCNRTPGQSDEDYKAACETAYADYRDGILTSVKKSGGQVIDKQEAYALIEEQILTRAKGLERLTLLCAIAAFFVFLAVSLIFAIGNAQNDRILRDHGIGMAKMLSGYLLTASLTAAATVACTLSVLFAVAAGGYFLASCTAPILLLSLPVLAALIPAAFGLMLYTKQLYKSSATK